MVRQAQFQTEFLEIVIVTTFDLHNYDVTMSAHVNVMRKSIYDETMNAGTYENLLY